MSEIFQGFRAVGQVCNHVPGSVQHRGKDLFLTTVVDGAYHIYNVSRSAEYRSLTPSHNSVHT